jgi:tetratricopeptide (TPR) repeat protein
MDLDELRPEDAQALLQSISSRIGSDAEELARVCGGLPLALRVAGRTLAERQDLVPAVYASRLAEGEGLGAVDGAFAASCGLLAPYLRRLWCLLSVFPSTFDGVAAAAVWELEESVSKDALGKLLTSSLIDWVAAVARYRLHDLARAYADRQLGGGEREAAGRRHAVYYLTVLGRADLLCRQMGEGALHGLRLLDAEWSNIEAGQAWAAAHPEANAGATGLCDAYSTAGAYGLALRQLPRQRVRWYEAALAAARWRKDRVAEAWYLGNLGIAYGDLGERRHAIELHEQCLAIARETGDLNTVGSALMNLGLTYADLEENRRAIEFYEQRLVLAREAGDHRAEGDTVNNMGLAYAALGENGRAIELYENRLAMARETGDQRGMIATLNNMGLAYAAVGENDRAIKLYEESLAKARETGDRGGESDALNNMGVAYAARGEYRQAVERYEKRLAIAREYSDWLGESSTLGNLGLAYTELGETGRAIECYGEQLAIARKTEDRWSEGWASWNLGLIFEGQGDLVRAVKLMQVLVDLERETGHADAEGDAAQVEEVRARLVAEGRHPTGSS